MTIVYWHCTHYRWRFSFCFSSLLGFGAVNTLLQWVHKLCSHQISSLRLSKVSHPKNSFIKLNSNSNLSICTFHWNMNAVRQTLFFLLCFIYYCFTGLVLLTGERRNRVFLKVLYQLIPQFAFIMINVPHKRSSKFQDSRKKRNPTEYQVAVAGIMFCLCCRQVSWAGYPIKWKILRK
jgi:hypothetical protein